MKKDTVMASKAFKYISDGVKSLIISRYIVNYLDFDSIDSVPFSKKERQLVLQIIIRYFELHLDGFRKPKSLQILETVFN